MVSYWNIFTTFAKIGAFTIGGGPAMLPLIQNELTKKGWIEEEEFADLVTLAQTTPGLLAVNISIISAYKLRGNLGSIVATIGSTLPSFIAILLIAMAFVNIQDNPYVIKIFKGIRPVVVALIAVPMVNMAIKGNKTWWAWSISVLSLVLVAFLKISPIYILMVIIVAAVAIAKAREGKK